MAQPRSGLADVLAATAFAGVASYVVTWLVPRAIGFADYQLYAVFWATLYLLVAALAGMQQEVARATVTLASDAPPQVNRARTFGVLAAGAIVLLVLATAPLWSDRVFPGFGWSLVLPLAAGAGGYALMAALGGTLQGLARWRSTALLISMDAGLRLAAIGAALLFTHDLIVLAWAAALPFGAAIAVLWPILRPRVVGRAQLDVGYRRLTWNVARTVTAATATGVMVSGFPLLYALGAADEPSEIVAMVILATTLVRAPLVVVALALQNWFLVHFRDAPAAAGRLLGSVLGGLGALALGLGALGWIVGPSVFAWLFPGEPAPDGLLVAALVVSSALVGSLIVTGSALLARSRHHTFTIGWVVGALVTIITVALPLGAEPLAIAALIAGPAAGLAVHLVALAVPGRVVDAPASD